MDPDDLREVLHDFAERVVDRDDASSQSPQAQRNSLADPQMLDAASGTYWPEPTATDAVNVEITARPYAPMYEPK